jgi:uncharacterized membrane protein
MTVSYCSKCGAQLAAQTASCTSCGQASGTEAATSSPDVGTSSSNVRVALPAFLGPACYLAGWITGLIILTWLWSAPANDPRLSFLRFHAAQSVVVFGGLSIIILVGIPIVSTAVIALGITLWLFLMFKASQRQIYKLPVGRRHRRIDCQTTGLERPL